MSKREIERRVSLRYSEYECGRLYHIGETEEEIEKKNLKKRANKTEETGIYTANSERLW